MKIKYWVYFCVLIFLVFAVEFDVAQRFQKYELAQAQKAAATTSAVATTESTATKGKDADVGVEGNLANATGPAAGVDSFYNKFIVAAQKISRTVSDPKEIEKEIDDLASTLTSDDLLKLSQVMRDQNEEGDNRAMAVELLSRHKNEAALQSLNDFVSGYQSAGSNFSRQNEFETVLRAQAIEGIAAYPEKQLALSYLDALTQKVDESFLKDRLVRSKESIKGRAPAVETQDLDALKKLTE